MVGCDEWDVLLVGDGSGTGGWTMSGAWACVTVERESDHRSICWGGWSKADIFVAELSAYMQALIDFEETRAAEMRRRLGRPIRVLVVSDNDTIVKWSERAMSGVRVTGATNSIWAALRDLVKGSGLSITWRFAPRRSTMLNVVVDQVCGRVRLVVQDPDLGRYHDRKGEAERELSCINRRTR